MPKSEDMEGRWLSLAKEARSQTEQLTDPQARLVLLRIATAYERLAVRARRQKASPESEQAE